VKVFAHLFQKVAGTGSARKTAFLFDSFFFVPCTVKEKAAMEFWIFRLEKPPNGCRIALRTALKLNQNGKRPSLQRRSFSYQFLA
jgi:hypothetical protein